MDLKTSRLPGFDDLPLVVEPASGAQNSVSHLSDLLNERREWIDDTLHDCGGILFRGFKLQDIGEFRDISQAAIPELKPYVEGQSPRTRVADNVYTSTEFPQKYRITLHNELSYTKTPPRRIVFHCHIEPVDRGETPIVDCRRIYERMNPEIRDRFEQHGVRYTKNMHGDEQGLGKSWMDHFETSDRDVVESYLNENDIEFEWTEDGSLRTWSVRPAAQPHVKTGQQHWFNQANLWHVTNIDERHRRSLLQRCGIDNLPTHAYYGDGTPIDEDDLNHVREVMWDNAVIFPWKQGDVLVLDNHLVAHGRMPYTGPRKILVGMG
jgi:alpha-ketoglutarate-dependent taurine dioxygenase